MQTTCGRHSNRTQASQAEDGEAPEGTTVPLAEGIGFEPPKPAEAADPKAADGGGLLTPSCSTADKLPPRGAPLLARGRVRAPDTPAPRVGGAGAAPAEALRPRVAEE